MNTATSDQSVPIAKWEQDIADKVASSEMMTSLLSGKIEFDSTGFSAVSECFLKGILQATLNRWPARSMGPLAFGQAVHKGYERLLLGDEPDAILAAANVEAERAGLAACGDEKRNFETLRLVVNDIILDHRISMDKLKPIIIDSKPAVEIPFRLPLGTVPLESIPDASHPSEIEVVWTGKIDAICAFRDDGMLWPVDHKTTTAFGPKFLDTYIRNYQFPGYVWANSMLHEVFRNEPRGIAVNVIAMRARGNEIKRLKVPYPQWKIEEWKLQVLESVGQFVQSLYNFVYREGPLLVNRTACTSKFGRCGFFDLCDYHPTMRERIYGDPQHFVEHLWSPFDS